MSRNSGKKQNKSQNKLRSKRPKHKLKKYFG